MLTPAIQPRRFRGPTLLVSLAFVSGALVGVAGSLVGFLVAPSRVVVVERQPEARKAQIAPHSPAATLTARTSSRFQTLDLLSPGEYVADGTLDEVFDVELTAPLAVKHIFVNGNRGYHQWDTVIGDDAIPFGPVYGGRAGGVTWHLGVREDGQWRTNPNTGALRELPAGTHRLELIGNGVPDSGRPRTVTVMFVDGTTMTAEVGPIAGCYEMQGGGGCTGGGNAN